MNKYSERKVRFKMYKAGKLWLVAGVAAVSWGMMTQSVQAADTDTAAPTTTISTENQTSQAATAVTIGATTDTAVTTTSGNDAAATDTPAAATSDTTAQVAGTTDQTPASASADSSNAAADTVNATTQTPATQAAQFSTTTVGNETDSATTDNATSNSDVAQSSNKNATTESESTAPTASAATTPKTPTATTPANSAARSAVVPTADTDFTYTTNADGTLTITGYTGTETALTIPSTIDGQTVTAIGVGAFYNNATKLTSVVIPDSVLTIGEKAFSGQTLTSLTLGNGVTTIGNSAFDKNELTSLVIPDSVITIEDSAFNQNKLVSVKLSSNLRIIGNGAFNMNELTSIDFPDSLESIDDFAFRFNQLAGVINIPDKVTTIGAEVFMGNHLTGVNLNNVTSIGERAFQDNLISSLKLSDKIESIDHGAFAQNHLSEIKVNGTPTIGDAAFAYNYIKNLDTTVPTYNNDQYVGSVTIPVDSNEINIADIVQVELAGKGLTGNVSFVADNGVTVSADGTKFILPENAKKNSGFVFNIVFTDADGNIVLQRAFMVNLVQLAAHNSTVYAKDGATWNPADNFDYAWRGAWETGTDGSLVDNVGNIDLSKVTVTGDKVDLTKPGKYQVTYEYQDSQTNAPAKKTITVTVKANQSTVTAKDSTLGVGDKWTAEDSFTGATDKDGQPVSFDKVTVGGDTVDTSKAGIYKVTYSYGGKTTTATITIKADQSQLTVHDVSATVGDAHAAAADFITKATDKDGADISGQVKADFSKVDWTKAGDYLVTLTVDGKTQTAYLHLAAATIIPEQPETPATPETPTTTTPGQDTAVKVVPTATPTQIGTQNSTIRFDAAQAQTNSSQLPQTGESENIGLLWLGAFSLLGAGLGLAHKKHDDNQEA